MFEKERAELRVLSNIAGAQGLDNARDWIRLAESEFEKRAKLMEERQREADESKRLKKMDAFNQLLPGGKHAGGDEKTQGEAGGDQQALGSAGGSP